jgi:hypothetical protein
MMSNKLNEGWNFFDNNDKLTNSKWDLPGFKIGDMVYIKNNAIETHQNNIPYREGNKINDFLLNAKPYDESYEIVEIAYNDDFDNWLIRITINNQEHYLSNKIFIKSKPNYKPKNIKRIIESIENNDELPVYIKSEDFHIIKDKMDEIGYKPKFDDQNDYQHTIRNNTHIAVFINFIKNEYDFVGTSLTIYDVERIISDSDNQKKVYDYYENTEYINNCIRYKTTKPLPNYKPKKIRRIIESEKMYPYRFKTEQEFLDKFGENWKETIQYEWCTGGGMDHLYDTDYPFYIERDGDLENIEYWSISWDMLTPNTIKSPSYKPKKIKRIIESNNKYPYRFKTNQEFIEEYGENWINSGIDWNDGNEMDYLFGQDYPFFIDEHDNLPKLSNTNPNISFGDWTISWDMLTPNIIKKPNYKPKRIKRIIEMNNTIETATGINVYIKKEKLDELIISLKNLDYIDDTIGTPKITDNMLVLIYFKDKKYALYFMELSLETTADVINRNINTDVFNNFYNYVYNYNTEYTIIMDILNNDTLIKPNYEPRTITRTLEKYITENKMGKRKILNFNEKMEISDKVLETIDYTLFKSKIKRNLFDSKYTTIAVKVNNEDEKNKLIEIFNKYNLFNDNEINRTMSVILDKPTILFLSLKADSNWESGVVYFTKTPGQFDKVKSYKDGVYPDLLTPEKFETILIEMTDFIPNYLPKRKNEGL